MKFLITVLVYLHSILFITIIIIQFLLKKKETIPQIAFLEHPTILVSGEIRHFNFSFKNRIKIKIINIHFLNLHDSSNCIIKYLMWPTHGLLICQ